MSSHTFDLTGSFEVCMLNCAIFHFNLYSHSRYRKRKLVHLRFMGLLIFVSRTTQVPTDCFHRWHALAGILTSLSLLCSSSSRTVVDS